MARQAKITAQMLDDLFADAMGGDWEAEREYRDLVRKLAKRANQQMLEQERRDVTGEAYRVAQDFLGGDPDDGQRKRFRENNASLSLEELQESADALISFTSARDYAIPYATESKEQIDDLLSPLAAAGVDIEDARVTFWMNELFKTEAWQEFKKAHGRSTDLIRSAQDAFTKGKTLDDLLNAYNQYREGGEDAPDLVQVWESFARQW